MELQRVLSEEIPSVSDSVQHVDNELEGLTSRLAEVKLQLYSFNLFPLFVLCITPPIFLLSFVFLPSSLGMHLELA
jgi:hypothetical protein